ncbi:hypothetical protein F4808DRAFT_411039 [Astrocystis sublimbata]|nr:hypothetical protein F4808DRAFT_411039 [Astrocystis sublimbata]
MRLLGALWRRKTAECASACMPRASPSPSPSLSRLSLRPRIRNRRYQSTKPPNLNPTNPSSSTIKTPPSSRVSQILARASRYLPQRLNTALQDLRSAPVSHIVAFLALHEITAIVPVVGIAYAFYTLDYMPARWLVSEEGLKKWTSYFRKKRWFGLEPEGERGDNDTSNENDEVQGLKGEVAENIYNIPIQVAAAYGITKMLLVPRIALSLWLTPSFARAFVGIRQAVRIKRN